MRTPCAAASSARAWSCSAASPSSSMASGLTLEQTSRVSAPSCAITSKVSRALEIAMQLRGGDALEVAKRLKEVDGQSELGGEVVDLRGREPRIGEVGLEKL